MCVRPLACELHWLNVRKKKVSHVCLRMNRDWLSSEHTTSFHCLRPAVFHMEPNHSRVLSLPRIHQTEREVSDTGTYSGLSLQLQAHSSKALCRII